MTQKIYIFSLILALLFSITGYTVTEHFCKMMVGSFVDQECMVDENMKMAESMLCCENDDIDCESKTPLNSSDCCETQSISKMVEDQFITYKQELNKKSYSVLVVLSIQTLIEYDNRITSHPSYTSDSSPPSSTNNIVIFNSALLI
jgi:hypothetical protein